jgi:phage gp36-like protein
MGLARVSGADHLSGRAVASYEAASHLISNAADGPARHGDMRRPFDEGVAALRARLAVALLNRSGSNEEASLHETALNTIADILPSLTAPHDLGEDASFSASLLASQCHYAVAVWLTTMDETDAARQRMKAAVSALEEIGCDLLALELSRDMDARWSSQAMALCAELEATGPATAA